VLLVEYGLLLFLAVAAGALVVHGFGADVSSLFAVAASTL
jgi:hypothetical protein